MMKNVTVNIKPVHDEHRNCIEDIYATVASWWQREYIYMFIQSWSFGYQSVKNNNDILGYRLSLNRDSTRRVYEQDRLLEKYCGIKIVGNHFKHSDDIYRTIIENLKQNFPTCIYINSYWCPWNPAFKKSKIDHYCLVVGFDSKTQSLLCIDPYFNLQDIQVLPKENFENGYGECITFLLQDKTEKLNTDEILKQAVGLLYSNSNNQNDFEKMRHFADEISTLEIKKEIAGFTAIDFAPIFRRLNQISWGRFNFAKVIKHLTKSININKLNNLEEDLLLAAKKWKSIVILLLTVCFSDDTPKKKLIEISEKIKDIADYEENIADRISNYLKSYSKNKSVKAAANNTFISLFTDIVKEFPKKTAMVFHDEVFTYEELDKKTNQLACLLRKENLKKSTIVGLMINRSSEIIIGIISILKAGFAYLPIDPNFPNKRIRYMLQDSGTDILFTQMDLTDKLDFEGKVICLDDHTIYQCDNADLNIEIFDNNLAYLIYTSGSTGNPKGVMIEHKSILNFIKGITRQIDFSANKSILSLTTISFDIFFLETLLPLTQGQTIVVADEKQQIDSRALNQLMIDYSIDMLQITPSRMQVLLNSHTPLTAFRNLKEIMIGGEPFPKSLLSKLRDLSPAKIYNMYGPTETTIWSTIKDLSKTSTINIGKPILNTQIYILDNMNKELQYGEVGELCIGGDGVARGYLNKPALTADKFIEYPLDSGNIIYKTGDLARILPNGEIEFLGRIDFQVKIRGFRIELKEIEHYLIEYPPINNCVVSAKENHQNEKYLIAYYLADTDIPVPEFISYLEEHVPEYMIPHIYMRLDKFPLTPNNKIDYKALPEPDTGRPVLNSEYKEAENEAERILVKIWQEVLGKEYIGIKDNFFELGGNSVSLALMHTKLEKHFPGKIEITDFFAYPTIQKIVSVLNTKRTSSAIDKINYLKLPSEYFKYKDNYEIEVSISNIDTGLYNKLKTISLNYQIKLINLFLAGYFFLLYNISKKSQLVIYIVTEDRLIRPFQLNFDNIADLGVLLKVLKTTEESNIPIPDNNTLPEDRNLILPVLYKGSQVNELRINNGLFLKINNNNEKPYIKLSSMILKKVKMEELINKYSNALFYIVQNSEEFQR